MWLNRDDDGYLLLNLSMLTATGQPRAEMRDNFWVALGAPTDLNCPPSGKRLHVAYDNGDRLDVEYFPLAGADEVGARYPGAQAIHWGVTFPITAVEIQMKVAGTDIEFGPRSTKLGVPRMTNCFASHCRAGVVFG